MLSIRNRLKRLEAAQRPPEMPLCDRSYYLPHTAYPRVLVEAFRNGDLTIEDGGIVSPEPKRRPDGWHCPRIAYVLNACAGWGDVFMDDAEIDAARELLDLGWIGFGYSYTQLAPHYCPPSWQVMLGHAATHELYVSDKARYFAAHATGRTLDAAIRVAAWRAGTPITTIAQVAAWLATAQPLALSMPMIEAVGSITASALVASHYGYDLDQLVRADNEQ
jgi:hypothetical protein